MPNRVLRRSDELMILKVYIDCSKATTIWMKIARPYPYIRWSRERFRDAFLSRPDGLPSSRLRRLAFGCDPERYIAQSEVLKRYCAEVGHYAASAP
jgi:hypothetical protein